MTNTTYSTDVLARIQAIETELLRAFDEVCDANGLTYFLDGGSALGAARHQGFIPWDDDVDVGMPIDDYRRFMEIAPQALPEGFSLHTHLNTRGYCYLWARIYKDGTRFVNDAAMQAGRTDGIFLDIFPFVQLEAGDANATRQRKRAVRWQRLLYLKDVAHLRFGPSPKGRLLSALCFVAHHTVARVIPRSTMYRRFEAATKTKNPGDKWVDICNLIGNLHEESSIFPVAKVRFGDLDVWAPGDLDAFCTELYGNWRQLPPPEERKTHCPLVLDFGDGVNVMERATHA